MLSRIADSLFWLTRYVERVDGNLRMIKVNYSASLETVSGSQFSWKPVLRIFSELREEAIHDLSGDSRKVLQYLLVEKENRNSVKCLVTHARENARGVQDHIALEVWSCINQFYHYVNEPVIGDLVDSDDPIFVVNEMLKHCYVFYGTAEITMGRGEGWLYMNLGKYLERCMQTADILDIKYKSVQKENDSIQDIHYWKLVLMSVSGYELYTKSYKSGIESRYVADMLILNTNYPRSILYCLNQLWRTIERLRPFSSPESYKTLEHLVGKARSRVQYTDLDQIFISGLHAYLESIKKDLYKIGEALNACCFACY
jgi:uncharacterized alpha-E superfamily protein